MTDQNKLAEILYRMQSDYIPEHKAAADDFLNESFPSTALLSIIRKIQQPNLVSMYFYICGKRNDEEVQNAWSYLRYRFDIAPEKFIANSYSPMLLSDEYRYLLFSARKYLLVKGKFEIFHSYLKQIEQEATPLIQNGTFISDTTPTIVIFYQWLKNFFAVYIPTEKETIAVTYKTKHGKHSLTENEVKQIFQKMRDMVINFSFDDYIVEAEKVSEYPNFRRYWENPDSYNAIPHKNPARMMYGRPFFPDVPCPYYDTVDELGNLNFRLPSEYPGYLMGHITGMLNECNDVEFRLDILNRLEATITTLLGKNRQAYRDAIASLYVYFYLEQSIYGETKYVLNFDHIVVNNDTTFYESLLLPYLSLDAFLDVGSKREVQAYMAIDALLAAKSIPAYFFVRKILSAEYLDQLEPPDSNYWDSLLRRFHKLLWMGDYVERAAWDIGMDWEILCQNIVKTHFTDILTNHDGICLENRAIPDIMTGTIRRNDFGRVIHVDRIIECKKSLYFTGMIESILNNDTTYKYYDFCDVLEYWILEKDSSFTESEIANSPKLKCVFANDLLEASWLSDEFKSLIRILLEEILRRDPKPSRNMATIEELCLAIEHLIEFPPPDIPVPLYPVSKSQLKRKHKKTKSFPIRQYALDGTFLKEYDSAKSAAIATKLSTDAITNVINGRRNSAGGFLWRRCKEDEPIENIIPILTSLNLKGKVIYQVDNNGEIVATFESLRRAEKVSGVNRRSISDALKGIQRTAGGFSWVLGDKILDK